MVKCQKYKFTHSHNDKITQLYEIYVPEYGIAFNYVPYKKLNIFKCKCPNNIIYIDDIFHNDYKEKSDIEEIELEESFIDDMLIYLTAKKEIENNIYKYIDFNNIVVN